MFLGAYRSAENYLLVTTTQSTILMKPTGPEEFCLKCRMKGLTVGRTNNEAIMAALRETLRYGLFLGTFAGGFCTVEETIAALGGCRR